jgi:hypothetical protein
MADGSLMRRSRSSRRSGTVEIRSGASRARLHSFRQYMATRQERIDALNDAGPPPTDQPLELLCEDHVGTYVIPFLCRWCNGAWRSLDTERCIEANGAWLAGAQPKISVKL